jgi:hypothetical protein
MVTVLEGKFGIEVSDATGTDVVYQIFLFGGMQQTDIWNRDLSSSNMMAMC